MKQETGERLCGSTGLEKAVAALRRAIDAGKTREFVELQMCETEDSGPVVTRGTPEVVWEDHVERFAKQLVTASRVVVLCSGAGSREDADRVRSWIVRHRVVPAVLDLDEELKRMLEDLEQTRNNGTPVLVVPSSNQVRDLAQGVVTASDYRSEGRDTSIGEKDMITEGNTSPSSEVLDTMRQSVLHRLRKGHHGESCMLFVDGVFLGGMKQARQLYDTRQLERMLRWPNQVMYGGLRYTRWRKFTGGKRTLGWKSQKPSAPVGSLQRPLG